MTRTEAIAVIEAALPTLSETHVETMLAMLKTWVGPSVFETLPAEERAKIDLALDRLDRGQSVPAEDVFAKLAAKLAAAGA